MTDAFVAENPELSRTVEIQGRNTLADLHRILFEAFARKEEPLYEFQVGGSRPNNPDARRYGLQRTDADLTGEVSKTAIANLGLSVGDSFGYWFDFGDDWWHQIDVTEIAEQAPKKRYPRITKRVGKSPPQYAEFD